MAIFCDRKFCEYHSNFEANEELKSFQEGDTGYCTVEEIEIDKKGKCLTYERRTKINETK